MRDDVAAVNARRPRAIEARVCMWLRLDGTSWLI